MKAHIIVIDDDETIRKTLTNSLKRSGYEASSYNYDSINLANLLLLQPDFVILNFTDDNNGIEWQFLQILKMEETTATIPILITATTPKSRREMVVLPLPLSPARAIIEGTSLENKN